jgi:hypothetical protein
MMSEAEREAWLDGLAAEDELPDPEKIRTRRNTSILTGRLRRAKTS